jgi:ABC-2 type transport system ATP-binding protein
LNENNDHIIKTFELKKSFSQVKAIRGVNLQVPKNSIFGFLGPNGAGKTTLMKMLLGLIYPTEGSGAIFGMDIVRNSVQIRERIGYLPQHPHFIEHMTARENILFAAKFFFKGPNNFIYKHCDEMLESVGLYGKADRPVKGFSGGEKQRLGIALAQVNQPELLILDEPAAALDPLGRQDMLEIMENLKQNTTVFYSTHILDDVQRVSDSVAILNQGRLAAIGPIDQIIKSGDGFIYSATIRGHFEHLDERLHKLPWVTHTSMSDSGNSTLWQISVSDDQLAEAELLRYILEDKALIVAEFSRKKYELEEIFLDIVKGHNHDI